MLTRGHSTVVLALAALLAGCSTTFWRDDADREVAGILGSGVERVLGDRADWVQKPVELPEPPADPAPEAVGTDPVDPAPAGADPSPVQTAEVYDLERALRTAVENNRDYLSRREGLYQAGLSYSLTRFNFGPQFSSAVNALWSDQELGNAQNEVAASLGASQILPTGGTLALTSSASAVWPYGNGTVLDSYGSSIGATLTQPLLRGAGYEVSHEALTQAERSLVYSIRDFELFRENFTIQVARNYFNLVSQRKTLAIEDTNYEGAVFDRKKAEALYQVDRNTQQEVFRARRREIEAQDQLITARAGFDRALDEFKILLGLPTTVAIDIADSEPPFERVRLEVDSAVAAARHNRLDLITQRQQVEDSERALRLAENGLLPSLDLTASYGLSGGGTSEDQLGPDTWNSSIGLQFEVPLQRKPERNSYRLALIQLEQVRRNYSLRLDQLDLEIRDALRQLRSIEERIVLQEGQIQQEHVAVTVTEIRYEAGTLDNRDLLEARQGLVNAKNALIRLKVDHFISRLSLLRDMGLFFVDDEGMWQ